MRTFIIWCIFFITGYKYSLSFPIILLSKKPEFSKLFEPLKKKIEGSYTLHTQSKTKKQILTGFSSLKIRTYKDIKLFLHLSLYNGKYRDSYITFEHIIPFEYLEKIKSEKKVILSMLQNSPKVEGSLFQNKFFFTASSKITYLLNMSFELNNDNNQLKLSLDLENDYIIETYLQISSDKINYKIITFILISQICSLCYFMSCIYVLFQIKNNKLNVKHISFNTLSINSLLNAVNTLVYANLSTQIEYNLSLLKVNSFLSFLTFAIGEGYILYLIRQNQEFNTIKMIKYFIEELVLMLIAFLYLCFYHFGQIVFSILFPITFIFQIHHHYKYKINNSTIPFYFIICLMINKLFLPLITILYGYELFRFPRNIPLFIFICLIHVFQILILYLQKTNGYLFFIPLYKRNLIYKYLVSFEDIIKSKKTISYFSKENCSICLKELLGDIKGKIQEKFENIKLKKQDIILNKKYENNYVEIQLEEKKPKKVFDNSVSISINIKNQNILNEIKRKTVFSMNKINKNESLIITPCNHIFHCNCIENWWKMKNECPVCRNNLPILEWDE